MSDQRSNIRPLTITAFFVTYFTDKDGDACCLVSKPCEVHKSRKPAPIPPMTAQNGSET